MASSSPTKRAWWQVEAVRLRDLKSDQVRELSTDGVFIFIGHDPNSQLFAGQLDMDAQGYLVVDRKMMTNIPGVFAAGEIMEPIYRQIATSVGHGWGAAMMAERWLA